MIRDLAQTGLKGRTITPGTVDVKIPAGMLDAVLTILGDPDLVTANVKAGANIFNVPGKASVVDTSDANAIASQILAGLYAYVNGVKITGIMPDNGPTGGTITTQGGTVAIPAGKTTGGVVTANIAGLVGSVITAPNVVGGITGTAIDGAGMKKYASGSGTTTSNGWAQVSGLSFDPSFADVTVGGYTYANDGGYYSYKIGTVTTLNGGGGWAPAGSHQFSVLTQAASLPFTYRAYE